jgi:hypothetical protein
VPDARQHETNTLRCTKGLARVDMRLIAAGIAALAVGFAVKSVGPHRIGSASAGPQAEPPGMSVFEAVHPNSLELTLSVGSQTAGSRVPVARLETEVDSAVGETKTVSEPFATSAPCASFEERFHFDRRLASFDERFAGAAVSPASAGKAAEAEERAGDILLPPRDPGHAGARPAVTQSAPELAPATTSPLEAIREKRRRTAEASTGLSLQPDADSHTAIYDIAARTVYLPNGHRLEAHSGLGSHLDDPRYVNAKGQGPTPPNVYNLALRERLFHGVRAIRLVPADDGRMFGRDGILAHSYMLGPSGQSNGCVSFRNYPVFLNAFLRGEVDRLVVVEHLVTATGAKTRATNPG